MAVCIIVLALESDSEVTICHAVSYHRTRRKQLGAYRFVWSASNVPSPIVQKKLRSVACKIYPGNNMVNYVSSSSSLNRKDIRGYRNPLPRPGVPRSYQLPLVFLPQQFSTERNKNRSTTIPKRHNIPLSLPHPLHLQPHSPYSYTLPPLPPSQ
jgi:hypothetical protein